MGAGQAPVGRPLGVYPLTLVSPATLSRQASGPMPSVPPWPASLGRVGVWAPEPPELPRLSVGISFMAWGDAAPSQQKAGEELGKHHWPSFPSSAPGFTWGQGSSGRGRETGPAHPVSSKASPCCWAPCPSPPRMEKLPQSRVSWCLGSSLYRGLAAVPELGALGWGLSVRPARPCPVWDH